MFGVFLMGISFLLFGLASHIENINYFLVLSFATRFLQGMASSSIQTTCYSIATNFYPEKKEALVGYIEAFTGIGLMIGPVLGSILYHFGGYRFTFYMFGGFFVVFSLLVKLIFPKGIDQTDSDNEARQQFARELLQQHESYHVKHEIGYFTLLRNAKYSLAAISGALGYFVSCYMEPILAFRLAEFQLSQLQIGFFFVILPAFYIIMSILVQFIPRGIEKRAILITAIFLSFFVNICVGPSQFFAFPNSIIIMGIGQALHGLIDPFILVPSLPEMIEAAVEKHPDYEYQINDLSSGIFNCFLGIGQILGPLYSSFMAQHVGFRLTCDYVGFFCLAFSIIYFVLGNGPKAFKESEWTNYGYKQHFGHAYMQTPLNRSNIISDFSQTDIRWRKNSLLTQSNYSLQYRDHSFLNVTPQIR